MPNPTIDQVFDMMFSGRTREQLRDDGVSESRLGAWLERGAGKNKYYYRFPGRDIIAPERTPVTEDEKYTYLWVERHLGFEDMGLVTAQFFPGRSGYFITNVRIAVIAAGLPSLRYGASIRMPRPMPVAGLAPRPIPEGAARPGPAKRIVNIDEPKDYVFDRKDLVASRSLPPIDPEAHEVYVRKVRCVKHGDLLAPAVEARPAKSAPAVEARPAPVVEAKPAKRAPSPAAEAEPARESKRQKPAPPYGAVVDYDGNRTRELLFAAPDMSLYPLSTWERRFRAGDFKSPHDGQPVSKSQLVPNTLEFYVENKHMMQWRRDVRERF